MQVTGDVGLGPSIQPAIAQSPALLWGFSDPTDFQDSVRLQAYSDIDALLGKPMSLTTAQCAWGKSRASDGTIVYRPFPTARLQTDRDKGRVTILTWRSQILTAKTDLGTNLRSIVTGVHDAYINAWAQGAAAWGHPFFLRFNQEMNGWWWNGGSELDAFGKPANGNQLGDFIKAWQHCVDIFRANGAFNVTWVWCPNVVSATGNTLPNFFPGENYVDTVATDVYNFGPSKSNGPWIPFTQVLTGYPKWYGDTYSALQKIAPSKKILLAEFGCHDTGGDKAAWIADALSVMPKNFPQIMGWCWWNWSFPGAENWTIASPSNVPAAFASALTPATYIAANTFPFVPDMTTIKPYVLSTPVDLSGQISTLQGQLASATSQLQSTQTTLQFTQSQLESTQADAFSTHATLDQTASSLNEVTIQIGQTTSALADAQAQINEKQAIIDRYQEATRQLIVGYEMLGQLQTAATS